MAWHIMALRVKNGTYKADVHGDTHATLDGAADVVPVPGHALRYVAVDAHDDEEAGHVLDPLDTDTGEYGEPEHREKAVSDHEDT